MTAFFSTLKRDMVLSWRNGIIPVLMVIALIMMLLMIFLPREIQGSPGEYVFDALNGAPLRRALENAGAASESFADDREHLEQLLAENPNSTGIAIEGSLEEPEVLFIQQKSINPSSLEILKAIVESALSGSRDSGNQAGFDVIRIRETPPPLSINLGGLPVFLAFEVGILGFLLVAVFIFQEKQEGTLKAYRISPGGVWTYIFSKTMVFSLTGLAYSIPVIALAMILGLKLGAVQILNLFLLILWGSSFMTLLGLGFAAWFTNLSQWFFPGLLLLILNMLPFFGYVYPPFSPFWMSLLPSYGLIHSLHASLFEGGGEIVRSTLVGALPWLLFSAAFAYISARLRLMNSN